jgi:hypothetical protein
MLVSPAETALTAIEATAFLKLMRKNLKEPRKPDIALAQTITQYALT